MRRFFVSPENIRKDRAFLQGGDAHHLLNVLRLKKGDEVELFGGDGQVFRALIIGLSCGGVELSLLERRSIPPDLLQIDLAPALIKNRKMEMVIQKSTELGVRAILPYISDHSAVWPPGDRRFSRWQSIINESCKQCKQPWPPRCEGLSSFEKLMGKVSDYHLPILCWEEDEAVPLKRMLAGVPRPESILLVIGPEGGFSKKEAALARDSGFFLAGLGKRVLRAETAAIAAIAVLQYVYE